MNEAQKNTQETQELLTVIDQGTASEVTHGDAAQWPFYEQGVPPFIHWCPQCADEVT